MRVALVAVVKDETNLAEWIAYHRKIGFNRIFLIANDWTPFVLDKDVICYHYDGKCTQIHAYNNWLGRYGSEFDYVAFFDADEYLYMPAFNRVQDMLNGRSLGINWVFFGTNINIVGSYVVDRYLMRDDKPDKHIKTIMRISSDAKMVNPHFCNKPTFSLTGEQVIGPWAKLPTMDQAFIAHYYYQDVAHWDRKVKRGRADTLRGLRTIEEWNAIDYNKVFDNRLNKFLYGK